MSHVELRLRLVAYLVACGALALAGLFPVSNPDAYGHIAQGRQIAQLGYVPTHDTLSFFRDTPQPWHNYEWLSDLLTYRLYALGGADALLLAKLLLLALAAALLVRLAERIAGVRAAAIACVLLVAAIPAARFRLTERPHLVALPLSALYLLGFAHLMRGTTSARPERDRLWLATLALAHLAWVNLHGSHLLGLGLTLVHCVIAFPDARARARLFTLLGLQLAVSCISPYGPSILIDAIEHVSNPVYRELVSEWDAWKPDDPPWLLVWPVLCSLGLAAGVAPLLRESRTTRALLFCACLLGVGSFRSIRFVGEYLLLGAPVIAIGAARRSAEISLRKLTIALGLVLGMCAVLVPWGAARLPPYLGIGRGESAQGLPVGAGRWLATHAEAARVFATFEDSWYLMFAVPQARFLTDGRVPFYGPEHLHLVQRAFDDRAAFIALLNRFRVDTVVVRHTYHAQRLAFETLRELPQFRLVSIEDRYATFVRSDLPLRKGAALRALTLVPSYELGWLLDADAARKREIEAELAQLPDEETSRGYRGYVRAMLAIAPLMRPGHAAGLAAPSDAKALATLRSAQRQLARASSGADGVPIVDAYHALVSIALCDLGTAEHALELARREGESRETLLGAQELALRRGEVERVTRFLQDASLAPEAKGDAWLFALRAALASPPRCP